MEIIYFNYTTLQVWRGLLLVHGVPRMIVRELSRGRMGGMTSMLY